MDPSENSPWPDIPYRSWSDSCATLQLWTQIVGKIRLSQTPWLNHGWHVALYVTPRGLTTSPIPHENRSFEIVFNFDAHELEISVSDGTGARIALRPRSVAEFYREVMATLAQLGIPVTINERPCEIQGATRFSQDREHSAYAAEDVHRFWKALLQVDRVLKRFRTGFIGKSSPVHFFWGSFDLAVTRFSGRTAPAFTGKAPGMAASVMREAYSHEVSSAGFWPGGNGIDYPAFYSYTYPTAAQFRSQKVQPDEAFFSEALGEFLLPYDAVRTAADPETTLLGFLQSTYVAAAQSAAWDRAALECPWGVSGVPRAT